MTSPRAMRIREELERLRDTFDAAMGAPIAPVHDAEAVDLVLCDVGDVSIGIRVDDLQGVHPVDGLVPLVGTRPSLLGLLGVAGDVLAVHDLAALLRVTAEVRWVAVLRGAEGHGLGVSAVKTWLRVPADQVARLSDEGRPLVGGVIRSGTHAGCPVLDSAAARAALEAE